MAVIDPDISQRFHDGDLEALRQIVCHYQGSVFGIGLKLLGSVDDARDFSQDVFLHAYEKRCKYDPARSFEPWFYKIALNLGRGKLRKRKRERVNNNAATVDMVEETAETTLIDQEKRARVQEALSKLKPIYRECLALRFESDLRLHEIAETLGVSLGTVKTRLRRGLMAFKKMYVNREGLDALYKS